MRRRDLVFHLVVFGVIVALVVTAAAAGGAVFQSATQTVGSGSETVPEGPPPEQPAWDAEGLAIDRVDATGTVMDRLRSYGEDPSSKTIVIDAAHGNRVNREDIAPLVEALVRRGHEIRFMTGNDDIDEELSRADAFLVANPANPYVDTDVDQVQGFEANGGRVVILGEPNRRSVNIGLFGASVSTQRSRLDALAGRFGIAFGTNYVRNMDNNDGSYRNVMVEPAEGASFTGVDRAAVTVAAPVTVGAGGEELLVTAPGTTVAGRDGTGQYPVAVRDDDVLAIGDTSLFAEDRVAIADNEGVAAHVVSFMVSGEKQRRSTTNTTSNGTDSDGGSGSATPTPTPTATGSDGT